MTATYPGSIKIFAPAHVDVTDIIYAAHVNSLEDEVTGIESSLGANINISTAPLPSGVFNPNSVSYSNLNARLANIEQGIVGDSHNQYIKNTGGSVVNPSAVGVKGLVIKATSGQTANLQEWQNSAGTVVTWVDNNGVLNGALSNTLFTTKGDGVFAAGPSDPQRLPVGADGTFLKADSTATLGVAWSAVPDPSLAYSYAFLTMGAS